MLLWRVPIALLDSALLCWALRWQYELLRSGQGPAWTLLRRLAGDAAPDWLQALRELPALPRWGLILPWLAPVALLGILGAWLHHAVWDHTCLWMLGGLKGRHGFRATLIAEAEALEVGALGAALGLLGSIPGLGIVLMPPLLAAGAYFWVLRGFALAAFHGCETWKGVAATILHALLLLGSLCALGACFALLLARALA